MLTMIWMELYSRWNGVRVPNGPYGGLKSVDE